MQSELRTNTSGNVCLLLSLFDYFFWGEEVAHSYFLQAASHKLHGERKYGYNPGYKWDINHVIQFSVYSQNQSDAQSA